MGDRASLGQRLETFVYQELRRLGSWHERDLRFHHFRDKDGIEVAKLKATVLPIRRLWENWSATR